MSQSPDTLKRIQIIGGRVIDPSNALDDVVDVSIVDGKVASLGNSGNTESADIVIDAAGMIVMPGIVDLSVFLPEPGYEHKGTIASETRAAASGGITTLCCTPNTDPVIDGASVATLIQDLAKSEGNVRVYPIGAMTRNLEGQKLSEMHSLRRAGCIGVTNLRNRFSNNRTLLKCLEYAASEGQLVFFNSVDKDLEQEGCVHDGPYATRFGLPGTPSSSETVAVSRDLILVEQTGVRAHFGQLSCAGSVDLIAAAQGKGLPVTADVSIYHLLETEQAVENFNSMYHIQPPLRTKADRDALRAGLQEGVISAICSFHQPHEEAAKMAPFSATEPGISGLETLLPLGLRLVEQGILSIPELIEKLTLGPARVIGLKQGMLGVGESADLTIFSPEESWKISRDTLLSAGHNTPYFGERIKGKVHYTLLGGNRVYQHQSHR